MILVGVVQCSHKLFRTDKVLDEMDGLLGKLVKGRVWMLSVYPQLSNLAHHLFGTNSQKSTQPSPLTFQFGTSEVLLKFER